jgi:hypothetical protein
MKTDAARRQKAAAENGNCDEKSESVPLTLLFFCIERKNNKNDE